MRLFLLIAAAAFGPGLCRAELAPVPYYVAPWVELKPLAATGPGEASASRHGGAAVPVTAIAAETAVAGKAAPVGPAAPAPAVTAKAAPVATVPVARLDGPRPAALDCRATFAWGDIDALCPAAGGKNADSDSYFGIWARRITGLCDEERFAEARTEAERYAAEWDIYNVAGGSR